ncbi:hypothetical protein MGN01_06030 [Methylobacterium gnaphalii]|uniref:Uncharacterized protein n=1 Tax=Methylobacterium gnaphalii TaxID=1010610 RepID=A0A512JFP1_9HYPH|nr:hypothetical protein MGN01_06030 [Methylobacterium gnaphalii]GLS47524.1 hypothetical protein GCM10007885_03680 [Methylobacterium gnaphalii]
MKAASMTFASPLKAARTGISAQAPARKGRAAAVDGMARRAPRTARRNNRNGTPLQAPSRSDAVPYRLGSNHRMVEIPERPLKRLTRPIAAALGKVR